MTTDKRLRLLDSFPAQGSNGATYKVRVYEHFAAVAALGAEGDSWESTGEYEYKLVDGEHVAVDADGTMSIARSGVRLKKV